MAVRYHGLDSLQHSEEQMKLIRGKRQKLKIYHESCGEASDDYDDAFGAFCAHLVISSIITYSFNHNVPDSSSHPSFLQSRKERNVASEARVWQSAQIGVCSLL